MPNITLCMIVRDEETLLGDCLASVRGAVDDMVVVDTGSKDASKKVARDAGARVYDFTWCDDFAAARNEALRRASGEFVLYLDADERLGPGSAARLRAAIKKAKFDCGMLRLHDATKLDAALEDVVAGRERQAEVQLVPRLLRNTDRLAFVDAIHENVMPWLRRRGMRIEGIDADIVHLGATQHVIDSKGKIERNIRLLRARLERDPRDVEAYGYLAHDYVRSGSLAQAREATARGWELLPSLPKGTFSIQRLATARAHLEVQGRQYAEAHETMRVAREIEGENPDYVFFAAYVFESEAMDTVDRSRRHELLLAAERGYSDCLRFAGRVFAQSFVVGASTWYGATRLGTVQLQLGRPADALRAFEAVLEARPELRAARLGKAEATLALGSTVAALAQVEPLLDDGPDGWTLAASAASALGQMSDARLFVRRAQSLVAKGFIAPHRRAQLRELASISIPA
jgi:glycosyltransferase involved in cell wall biosynthesis